MAPPPSPAKLAAKNINVVWPGATALMRHLNSREKFEQRCSELFDGITKHGMNVKIHGMYPLSEVVRAHRDLEGRKTTGKVLMKP
jgi:NADPH2:quinone reductase